MPDNNLDIALPTDLSTATPVKIDTILARLDTRHAAARSTTELQQRILERHSLTSPLVTVPPNLVTVHNRLTAAQAEMDRLDPAINQLEREYERRPWNRAWIVLNSNGHIHTSKACSTCFPDTDFGWLYQVSGWAEEEIIAQAGASACTICYPNAPTEARQQPCKLDLPDRIAQRERRDAQRAERQRTKAEKAIAQPDGAPLRDSSGFPINTVVTAQNYYVEAAAEAALWRNHWPQNIWPGTDADTWVERCARNAAAEEAYAQRLLEALAHKHSRTVEVQRDELAARVAKKIRSLQKK